MVTKMEAVCMGFIHGLALGKPWGRAFWKASVVCMEAGYQEACS